MNNTCSKEIFSRICEEPLNKRLIERYSPQGAADAAHDDPIFLEILDSIYEELKYAASVLQDAAAEIWWWGDLEDQPEEQGRRDYFRSIFNAVIDKTHDLDALCGFARATCAIDSAVLQRVQSCAAFYARLSSFQEPGETDEQFAIRIGVSHRTLAAWKVGGHSPRLTTAWIISNALGVRAPWLAFGSGPKYWEPGAPSQDEPKTGLHLVSSSEDFAVSGLAN